MQLTATYKHITPEMFLVMSPIVVIRDNQPVMLFPMVVKILTETEFPHALYFNGFSYKELCLILSFKDFEFLPNYEVLN